MKKASLLALATLTLAAAGCTTRLGDFTVISTRNFNTTDAYEMVGEFEGEDSVVVILGIPFGTPNLETAIDEALRAGNGTYMANTVLELVQGPFSIAYRARGDVYAVASQAAVESGDVFYLREGDGGLTVVDREGAEVGGDRALATDRTRRRRRAPSRSVGPPAERFFVPRRRAGGGRRQAPAVSPAAGRPPAGPCR